MAEEILTQQTQPEQKTPFPVQTDSRFLKYALFALAGLLLLAGAAYGGYWYGTESAKLKPQTSNPQSKTQNLIPVPTSISTLSIPTITPAAEDETADWKTYTNNFAKFLLKYPEAMSYSEKSFSEKEKQVVFNGPQGSLNIHMATMDTSPGFGGGCDEVNKGQIVFLNKETFVCINEKGIWAFYPLHPKGYSQLSISASFTSSLDKEEFLNILSTFKFLD